MIFKVMLFHLDNIYHEKVFANIELLTLRSYLTEAFHSHLERAVKIMELMPNTNCILICSKQIIRFSSRSKSELYLVF